MAFSVIFAGTPAFAVPSLRALAADKEFNVQLVITQPDKPVGRKKTITPPPVKAAALELGIPVWQPENINTGWAEIPCAQTDFLVVVAYGQILKQNILDFPEIAPVNVHASLLPRWRGASPIHHAILAGDTETGVTVQRMAAKLDTGPVLARKSVHIGARETFTELHDTLAACGADLLTETLKAPLAEEEQDETQATLCRKLSRATGEVQPETMTAEEIDRRVRALNPWPGVRCTVAGVPLKLLATSLQETPDSTPLPCKNSVLHLVSVQQEGRTAMTGKTWARGRQP